MTRQSLYIKVKPQIVKDLVNTLVLSKATFEINTSQSTFYIKDISAFNYDMERGDGMYRFQIDTENNTKDIFLASENMEEFTVHFR